MFQVSEEDDGIVGEAGRGDGEMLEVEEEAEVEGGDGVEAEVGDDQSVETVLEELQQLPQEDYCIVAVQL